VFFSMQNSYAKIDLKPILGRFTSRDSALVGSRGWAGQLRMKETQARINGGLTIDVDIRLRLKVFWRSSELNT
jgi:hypothetical protein